MFRTSVVRTLGMLAVVAATAAATTPQAFAGWCHRGCYSCCYYYVPCDPPHPPAPPPHPDPDPVRQVRVIYFSHTYSGWFEVDAVVPAHSAQIGLSAAVTVPRVGYVRGWIVSVYTQPRMNSPYKTEVENAHPQQGGGPAGTTSGTETSKPVVPTSALAQSVKSIPLPSALKGHVRLWTNRAGTKRVYAELLQIRNDSVLVRDASGSVYEQPFNNLSDADVAFVRSGSVPATHFALR